LGDANAHFSLSVMYDTGEGIEKDMLKHIHHLEEAAIGGHPEARHNLGIDEAQCSRFNRSKKHFIIAANLGHQDSLNKLRQLYADGHATKEDYADALRAFQAAVAATKSVEREEADAYYEAMDAGQQS
jgi:TPR repeat protein